MRNQRLEELMKDHMGFIIKTTSDLTGRYVSVENDDAFSVALEAFHEAYERHDAEKGPFLPYVKLVIRSRLINFLKKEQKDDNLASMDEMEEEGSFFGEPSEMDDALKLEILEWEKELSYFSIDFEKLVEHSPKHKDTRKRAIDISEKSGKDREVTSFLYEKKRLPIKMLALKHKVTEKIIKRSKVFILSLIIVFFKNFEELIRWIKR